MIRGDGYAGRGPRTAKSREGGEAGRDEVMARSGELRTVRASDRAEQPVAKSAAMVQANVAAKSRPCATKIRLPHSMTQILLLLCARVSRGVRRRPVMLQESTWHAQRIEHSIRRGHPQVITATEAPLVPHVLIEQSCPCWRSLPRARVISRRWSPVGVSAPRDAFRKLTDNRYERRGRESFSGRRCYCTIYESKWPPT